MRTHSISMSASQGTSQGDFDAIETITHARRCHTIRLLSETSLSLPLAEIASAIASRELAESNDRATLDHARKSHLILYHKHTAWLVDIGIIKLHQARKMAALTESVAQSMVENATESANGVGLTVAHS